MTFEEYDKFVETLEQHPINYLPTLEEIDLMETDIRRWMPLAIQLYNNGRDAETKDEKYRKKTLYRFIVEHLELNDEDDVTHYNHIFTPRM